MTQSTNPQPIPRELQSHPCYGPAVLWLTFYLQGKSYKAAFKHIFRGVMKDKGVTQKQVDAFLTKHQELLEPYVREQALPKPKK